jgi:hypothetical protein
MSIDSPIAIQPIDILDDYEEYDLDYLADLYDNIDIGYQTHKD